VLPDHPDRPDDLRVSDAERERVIGLLRTHCADGRLTLDEFGDRVSEVLTAKTAGELGLVTRQLPVTVPVGQVEPERVGQRRAVTRWAVAIMGGHSMKGRWRVREEMNALAIMGGCDIDLRHAEVEGPEVTITAIAIMGGIDVIVPEGIEVELTGHAFMGGRDCRIADVPRLPGSPGTVPSTGATGSTGTSTTTSSAPSRPRPTPARPWPCRRRPTAP
jgi:hypothetical protein